MALLFIAAAGTLAVIWQRMEPLPLGRAEALSVTVLDRNDRLWLADDKDHTVHQYTTDGKRLMTLGESGKAADTGYKIGASPVLRAGGPFHRVTNVAATPTGELYIADG